MALREFEFGLFDSQASDIDGDFWSGFRSIIVYGNTTNQEAGILDYNPTDFDLGGNDLRNAGAVTIAISQIKSVLGQIPVLVRVDFSMSLNAEALGAWVNITRAISSWDVGDSSNRYKDKSALITWYEDVFAPFPSQDALSVEEVRSETKDWNQFERMDLTITSMVRLALRNNGPIEFFLWGQKSGGFYVPLDWKPAITTRRPYLHFWFLYPIEFYEDVGGNLDYSSPVQETEDGHYYLGAVERGQTGSAVKCWARNYTETTKQVEIFDDHAEWTTPVQRAGTGTGKLDYVTLAENATSQLYTVVFYSPTQFEVKAEAYRDNSINYHPQINADANWRGTVGGDFTTPDGGFTIPAAAWQSVGIATDDEIEIGVRGNTTDTSWPVDSNDQVEMTYDDAGVADAAGWRPIVAHREQLTNTVAVDGTSIFFPIRHMLAADWPVGNKILVHDITKMDEGTVTSVQSRLIGVDTFTGTGNDDITITGNYNGNASHQYRVECDGVGTPNTFSWSRTGDSTWIETGVEMNTSPIHLENGVYVQWALTTGHVSADRWDFDADTWGITVGGLTVGSNSYASGSYLTSALPLRDLTSVAWSTVDADSGVSQSPASRIYLSDTSPFTQGDNIFIQATGTDDYESATIDTGGVQAGYLDLTTSLVNDYSDGDFCTKKGSGEAAFWLRPVASSITVEELKRLRFNARML